MADSKITSLILLRHFAVDDPTFMMGRGDPGLAPMLPKRLRELRALLDAPDHLITSPARRCVETAALLWPDRTPDRLEPGLWEQDFGAWEGKAYTDLPDLGPLSQEALAAYDGHGGESYLAMAERVVTGVSDLLAIYAGSRIAICAHAGPIRAVLAHCLGVPSARGLSFRIDPGAFCHVAGSYASGWAITAVNR